ncbi:MAG: SPOR domain-containing protein [bacterium]
MDKTVQKRLVGTAVLVALAVIFVPMMFDGPKEKEAVSMQIEIPPKPVYDIPDRLSPPAEQATVDVAAIDKAADQMANEAEASAAVGKNGGSSKVAAATPPKKAIPESPKSVAAAVPEKPAPKVVTVPASAEKKMAPSPEKKELSQIATAGKGAGFVVQVGSFGSKDNADKLKKKLAGNGYPSFVELTKLKTRDIYRVKVGPKPSRKEANRLRLELIDEEKLEGIIVSFP